VCYVIQELGTKCYADACQASHSYGRHSVTGLNVQSLSAYY
jgi:hypothetical protein